MQTDGTGVVTASGNHAIRVFSLSGGETIHLLDIYDDCVADESVLGGYIIPSVGCDGVVIIWKSVTGYQ